MHIYSELILRFISKHRWFSGRMLACHAGGPGSIPGRCKLILILPGTGLALTIVAVTCSTYVEKQVNIFNFYG
jgi:hypothetical protein